MTTFKGFDQYELVELVAPGLEAYMDAWFDRRTLENEDFMKESAQECALLEYEQEMQHQLYRVLSDMPLLEFNTVRHTLIDFVFAIANEQGDAGYPRFYHILPHIEDRDEFLRYFFLLYPKLWS